MIRTCFNGKRVQGGWSRGADRRFESHPFGAEPIPGADTQQKFSGFDFTAIFRHVPSA